LSFHPSNLIVRHPAAIGSRNVLWIRRRAPYPKPPHMLRLNPLGCMFSRVEAKFYNLGETGSFSQCSPPIALSRGKPLVIFRRNTVQLPDEITIRQLLAVWLRHRNLQRGTASQTVFEARSALASCFTMSGVTQASRDGAKLLQALRDTLKAVSLDFNLDQREKEADGSFGHKYSVSTRSRHIAFIRVNDHFIESLANGRPGSNAVTHYILRSDRPVHVTVNIRCLRFVNILSDRGSRRSSTFRTDRESSDHYGEIDNGVVERVKFTWRRTQTDNGRKFNKSIILRTTK